MEQEKFLTLNNISKDEAWRMINKFREHYKGSEVSGAEYLSHGVWFSIQDLQNWMDAVKSAGCNGVRIYFATYLDSEMHPHRTTGRELDYSHRNTVVLIGTIMDRGVERHYYKIPSLKKLDDPLNKGELCPEQCSEPDK